MWPPAGLPSAPDAWPEPDLEAAFYTYRSTSPGKCPECQGYYGMGEVVVLVKTSAEHSGRRIVHEDCFARGEAA